MWMSDIYTVDSMLGRVLSTVENNTWMQCYHSTLLKHFKILLFKKMLFKIKVLLCKVLNNIVQFLL